MTPQWLTNQRDETMAKMKLSKISVVPHLTVEDGELQSITSEMVIEGELQVFMEGKLIGTTDRAVMEIPVWKRGERATYRDRLDNGDCEE